MSKKRRVKRPDWRSDAVQKPAAAAPLADLHRGLALQMLRLDLVRSCADFALEATPLLREMGALGERLDAYVKRAPTMSVEEIQAGLQGIGKGRAMLRIVRRLVTPAPGTERKQ